MDLATVGGLVLAVGAILIAYIMEGGHVGSVFQIPAMTIVILGTLGAGIITTSLKTVFNLPNLMMIASFEKKRDPKDVINQLVRLAEKARREGLLPLEEDARNTDDPFLRRAIELMVDGTDPALVRNILETDIVQLEQRHKKGVVLLQKLGGFSPTLGVLGTVLGLVHTLGNIEDASKMAESIAGAFIATLWGVGLANLFYLPMGDKLKVRSEGEVFVREMMLEGIQAIQAGENVRVVRGKLLAYLSPADKAAMEEGAEARAREPEPAMA